MNLATRLLAALLACYLPACGHHGSGDDGHGHSHDDGAHGHSHDEGHQASEGGEPDHEVVSIGSATLGDVQVTLSQGHGAVAAGKESHLVVKLPYSDDGQTVVRAWIGTQDRTLSYVGKATYDAGHDEYDVHATAPDPLPNGAMWWVELQKPDGAKSLGSSKPLME